MFCMQNGISVYATWRKIIIEYLNICLSLSLESCIQSEQIFLANILLCKGGAEHHKCVNAHPVGFPSWGKLHNWSHNHCKNGHGVERLPGAQKKKALLCLSFHSEFRHWPLVRKAKFPEEFLFKKCLFPYPGRNSWEELISLPIIEKPPVQSNSCCILRAEVYSANIHSFLAPECRSGE